MTKHTLIAATALLIATATIEGADVTRTPTPPMCSKAQQLFQGAAIIPIAEKNCVKGPGFAARGKVCQNHPITGHFGASCINNVCTLTQPKIGSPCNQAEDGKIDFKDLDYTCPVGTYCSAASNLCTPFPEENESCAQEGSSVVFCGGMLKCVAGKCAKALSGNIGDNCSPDAHNCKEGLQCVGGQCQAGYKAGDSCADADTVGYDYSCPGIGCLSQTASGAITCVARYGLGETCGAKFPYNQCWGPLVCHHDTQHNTYSCQMPQIGDTCDTRPPGTKGFTVNQPMYVKPCPIGSYCDVTGSRKCVAVKKPNAPCTIPNDQTGFVKTGCSGYCVTNLNGGNAFCGPTFVKDGKIPSAVPAECDWGQTTYQDTNGEYFCTSKVGDCKNSLLVYGHTCVNGQPYGSLIEWAVTNRENSTCGSAVPVNSCQAEVAAAKAAEPERNANPANMLKYQTAFVAMECCLGAKSKYNDDFPFGLAYDPSEMPWCTKPHSTKVVTRTILVNRNAFLKNVDAIKSFLTNYQQHMAWARHNTRSYVDQANEMRHKPTTLTFIPADWLKVTHVPGGPGSLKVTFTVTVNTYVMDPAYAEGILNLAFPDRADVVLSTSNLPAGMKVQNTVGGIVNLYAFGLRTPPANPPVPGPPMPPVPPVPAPQPQPQPQPKPQPHHVPIPSAAPLAPFNHVPGTFLPVPLPAQPQAPHAHIPGQFLPVPLPPAPFAPVHHIPGQFTPVPLIPGVAPHAAPKPPPVPVPPKAAPKAAPVAPSHAGLIVGITLGSLAGVALIGALVFFFYKRFDDIRNMSQERLSLINRAKSNDADLVSARQSPAGSPTAGGSKKKVSGGFSTADDDL